MNVLSKVSVVTICLNASNSLSRTIESVATQNHPDVEYFIVDGGSNDGTLEVIKNADCISDWTSEKDDGIADAFNKGIRKGTGDLIGIINADDWYEPNAINEIANAYQNINPEKRDRTIFHGDIQFVSKSSTRRMKPRMKAFSPNHWSFYFDMPVHHPTCFVPRKLYETVGGFDTSYSVAMDFEFMIRARNAGAEFHYIPSVIANFSVGGVSTSQTQLALHEVRRAQLKNGLSRLPCEFSFLGKLLVNRLKALWK